MPVPVAVQKARVVRAAKERVLVEFPKSLLKRADEVAREMNVSRSELIRGAVEARLKEIEIKRFEQELAEGYLANAEMNLALLEEFKNVDNEAF
jgi:metal-responsive CopG/Arc/MetJ family transcriptional regulator